MKTLNISFENTALKAFDAYVASLKMSTPEILATMVQDLLNFSSSLTVKGRNVKGEIETYFSASLKTLAFTKLAVLSLLSSSIPDEHERRALIDDLEKRASAELSDLLVYIRRGLPPSSLSCQGCWVERGTGRREKIAPRKSGKSAMPEDVTEDGDDV